MVAPLIQETTGDASAHDRAREVTRLGHDVRLMQPGHVKGKVKRGKTDKADAEAIC